MIQVVNQILVYLTITSQVFLLIFLLSFASKLKIKKWKLRDNFLSLIKKNSLKLAFTVSLVATLGSLFFSEIAGYDPCKLCWFQRIFMYPQVIILGASLLKNKKGFDFSFYLSIVGILIALYHYSLTKFSSYYSSSLVNFCSTIKGSCIIDYLANYGYVNIPMMSFTAFALIVLFYKSQKM